MSRNIVSLAFALVITSAAAQEDPQVKLVKTVVIVPLPDFNDTFNVIDVAVEEAKRVRALALARQEVPVRSPRHRTVASHLQRYCAKPGKDTKSWIRVNGRRFYCPA